MDSKTEYNELEAFEKMAKKAQEQEKQISDLNGKFQAMEEQLQNERRARQEAEGKLKGTRPGTRHNPQWSGANRIISISYARTWKHRGPAHGIALTRKSTNDKCSLCIRRITTFPPHNVSSTYRERYAAAWASILAHKRISERFPPS